MQTQDINTLIKNLPVLNITPDTTDEEAEASFGRLVKFDKYTLVVTRFTGLTPWELHPDGDELLHILDGEVDVTVLAPDGLVQFTIQAGSVCVIPQGLWHRQLPRPIVTLLSATPTETTEISFADDPRQSV